MAFLEKKDPIVINIKITSKGREQLSLGKLSFKKFVIGDSEIDYGLIKNNNISPSSISILKAKDKNPEIISYLKKNESSDKYNNIPNVVSNTSIITNQAKEYGFFSYDTNTGNYSLITEPTHVKQPDMIVDRSTLVGDKELVLKKASTYQANVNEPAVGDILAIKFDNDTVIFDKDNPKPLLFYKVRSIKSGSINGNNLVIIVDRNLPDFNGNGAGTNYRVVAYLPKLEYIVNNEYPTDYLSNEVFSFITNIQQASGEIPIWNFSVIYSDEIEGTTSRNRLLKDLPSSQYASFISYIQNHNKVYSKLGIVHYTNQIPNNTLGEGLYNNTAKLIIPTVMWHKSSEPKLGVELMAGTTKKILSGLNLEYYDLRDINNNIVGKIFNTLKLFIIEDQELLYAMSYKSNRSWTLPEPTANLNIGLSIGCPECGLECTIIGRAAASTTANGIIEISNVANNSDLVYVEVKNNSNNNVVHISQITTLSKYEISVPIGNYTVKVMDTGSSSCSVISVINISLLSSNLS